MITIISAIIFLVVAFFSYATNLTEWYEFIPFAFLLLPPYLYVRNIKIVNVFFLIGTLFTGVRFYTNWLLVKHQYGLVVAPVTMDQPIVRQFTGLVVILVLYVWYMYIFYACATTIRELIKSSETYEKLVKNNRISRYINMFTMTTLVMFAYFIVNIWMYDLAGYSNYLLIFICTATIIACCFYALCTDMVRVRKEQFLEEMKKEHPSMFDKEDDMEIIDLNKSEDEQDISYINPDDEGVEENEGD